jgi:hypothetical protein
LTWSGQEKQPKKSKDLLLGSMNYFQFHKLK